MNKDNTSDEELYLAYHNGDMTAFDALYGRYRQCIHLFLLRQGHAESTAEDLFHDCWLRVIKDKRAFDGKNFRAWIYTIARNLSTDAFRKANIRIADSLDDYGEANTHVSTQRQQEALDCVELIKSSVAALPIEQRDVFLLKEEAGLSLQQIADVMAVGRETIKSRIRYAMQRLKQLMEDCL